MRKRLRTSLHALGEAFLARQNAPVRGVTVGRFVILWNGKPGDYMETISTEEFFGDPNPGDIEWCVPCGRDHSATGPCPEPGDPS